MRRKDFPLHLTINTAALIEAFAELIDRGDTLVQERNWDWHDPILNAVLDAQRALGQAIAPRLNFAELQQLADEIAARLRDRWGRRYGRIGA